MNRKQKSILIVSIIGLFLVIAGITYAYFSARITGVESTSTIVLTGGRMEIVYDNLSGNITAENIYPREEAWVTKNFTVTGTNSTNQTMKYRVGLEVLTSGFGNGDLTYSLTNTNSDSGTPISDVTNGDIPSSGIVWFGKGSFITGTDQEHAYTLNIYFPDTGEDQNDLQGAAFSALVVIEGIGEEAPKGWSNAPAGSLLAGIKANNASPTEPLTTPGVEMSLASGLADAVDTPSNALNGVTLSYANTREDVLNENYIGSGTYAQIYSSIEGKYVYLPNWDVIVYVVSADSNSFNSLEAFVACEI